MLYGQVMSASDVEKVLREENNFKKAYSDINTSAMDPLMVAYGIQDLLTKQAMEIAHVNNQLDLNIDDAKRFTEGQIDELGYNMNRGALQNFVDSEKQKSAVLGSRLGQGNKENLINDLDSSLDRAYQSWLSNYNQGVENENAQLDNTIQGLEKEAQAKINEINNRYGGMISDYGSQSASNNAMVQSATENIDKIVQAESENYEDFYNTIYNYSDWLFNDETGPGSQAFETGRWSDLFMNENGYVGSAGLSERMFDENGALTDDGREIINMLLSDSISLSGDTDNNYIDYTFDKYLQSSKKEDLAKWLMGGSIANDEMTNMQHALHLIGIDSLTPYQQFTDVERFSIDSQTKYNDEHPNKPKVKIDGGNTNYYRGYDFGTIAVYDNGSQPIIAFDDLELGADKNVNNKDGESFTMNYTDDSGNKRKYHLELVDEDKGSDVILKPGSSIYNKIKYNVGHLIPNKLYSYGESLYVAVEDSGGIVLRKLQGSGAGGTYKTFVSTMTNKQQWGNRYSRYDLLSGKAPKDNSTKISQVDIRNNQYDAISKYLESGEFSGHLENAQMYNDPRYTWDYKTGRFVYNPFNVNPNRRR